MAGATVAVAKASIEQQLSQCLEQPRVSVDVYSYNSKVYYLIVQAGTGGDSVIRCPATGGDTVLDSLAQATGKLPNLAECWIWVARPGGVILPVDWQKVVEGTDTTSNWRIAAGDRIFIRRRSVPQAGTAPQAESPRPAVPPAVSAAATAEQTATDTYAVPFRAYQINSGPTMQRGQSCETFPQRKQATHNTKQSGRQRDNSGSTRQPTRNTRNNNPEHRPAPEQRLN